MATREGETDAARDRERLREAHEVVAFFASVIKSGEPWSPQCQAAIDRLSREEKP
jgi:hypothetical protein